MAAVRPYYDVDGGVDLAVVAMLQMPGFHAADIDLTRTANNVMIEDQHGVDAAGQIAGVDASTPFRQFGSPVPLAGLPGGSGSPRVRAATDEVHAAAARGSGAAVVMHHWGLGGRSGALRRQQHDGYL